MRNLRPENPRYSKFRASPAALMILFSSLLLSAAGQAAEPLGAIKFTRGIVTIESISGETRRAETDDDLMQNELIETGADGVAVIQLIDDSRMTLRPNSEFRVELMNTADAGNDSSQQSAVLNLLRGGLRLVTGLISKANPAGYRLNTPVATIGIRGTEFNTRICVDDCAAEESRLAGGDAAANIGEGLYVNVDEGRIFLENDATVEPLDLNQGESGYVADLNTLPVKLVVVPAFLGLDNIPSPGQLDFNDIQLPDDAFRAAAPEADVAGMAASPASDEVTAEVELSGTYAGFDVSGTYEIEVKYGQDLPPGDRRWFWGNNPDIEFTLTQNGDEMKGDFSGDLEGTIEGIVDDDEVSFEFLLEALGGETKSGYGTWIIQKDGSLQGDFNIEDRERGVVRGRWTLTRIVSSGSSAIGIDILLVIVALSLIGHVARLKRRRSRPLI